MEGSSAIQNVQVIFSRKDCNIDTLVPKVEVKCQYHHEVGKEQSKGIGEEIDAIHYMSGKTCSVG